MELDRDWKFGKGGFEDTSIRAVKVLENYGLKIFII